MLQQLVAGLLATSPLEAAAVVFGLAYSVLAVRGRRECWIAGGLSSLLFVYLSAVAALPMQSGLQVYYVIMALYGWVRWSRPGPAARIGTLALRWHCVAIAIVLAASVPAAALLARETHAAWPYLDSVTTLGSLFATWLIARRILENWLYWILIDALLAFLFAAQGLLFTALLFTIYLGVSTIGWFTWRRHRDCAQ
ncbi:MAG: nicotinamide riboside transporter PnuC [Steroidobacteraceae bacterium]